MDSVDKSAFYIYVISRNKLARQGKGYSTGKLNYFKTLEGGWPRQVLILWYMARRRRPKYLKENRTIFERFMAKKLAKPQ